MGLRGHLPVPNDSLGGEMVEVFGWSLSVVGFGVVSK
jgi:hypothetical protein